jgi:hypothetical protein
MDFLALERLTKEESKLRMGPWIRRVPSEAVQPLELVFSNPLLLLELKAEEAWEWAGLLQGPWAWGSSLKLAAKSYSWVSQGLLSSLTHCNCWSVHLCW